jgi:hypothetical protein
MFLRVITLIKLKTISENLAVSLHRLTSLLPPSMADVLGNQATLLDLPRELRDIIYELYLGNEIVLRTSYVGSCGAWQHSHDHAQLLFVSRQIYTELSETIRKTRVCIDAPLPLSSACLLSLGPPVQNIRHLELSRKCINEGLGSHEFYRYRYRRFFLCLGENTPNLETLTVPVPNEFIPLDATHITPSIKYLAQLNVSKYALCFLCFGAVKHVRMTNVEENIQDEARRRVDLSLPEYLDYLNSVGPNQFFYRGQEKLDTIRTLLYSLQAAMLWKRFPVSLRDILVKVTTFSHFDATATGEKLTNYCLVFQQPAMLLESPEYSRKGERLNVRFRLARVFTKWIAAEW